MHIPEFPSGLVCTSQVKPNLGRICITDSLFVIRCVGRLVATTTQLTLIWYFIPSPVFGIQRGVQLLNQHYS